MSRYDATEDPLCYPGTHVLRNKADLRNQDDLDQFEQLMFLTRSDEPLPDGHLDYDHYKRIHHHSFQDVYDWAGKRREIRAAKGGNWFCYPEYIDLEMENCSSNWQVRTTWRRFLIGRNLRSVPLTTSLRSTPFTLFGKEMGAAN